MTTATKRLLEAVETWPEEDQQELLEAARDIQARRRGVYEATKDELAALDKGIKAADEGRFATDDQIQALRAKFRRA